MLEVTVTELPLVYDVPVPALFVFQPKNVLPLQATPFQGTVMLVPEATVCGSGCPDGVPLQLVVISKVMVGLTVTLYTSSIGQMVTSLGVMVAVTVVVPTLWPVTTAELPLPATVTMEVLLDAQAIVYPVVLFTLSVAVWLVASDTLSEPLMA